MRGKKMLKVILPVVVLFASFMGLGFMASLKDTPEVRTPVKHIPMVRVQPVRLTNYRFKVFSQGEAKPKSITRVSPQISGRVVEINPNFTSGGFFEKGETLFKIDEFDYRTALVTARADLARAELMLSREEAETEVAKSEWRQLGNGESNPLALRQLQLKEAQASVDAARARVDMAEMNLNRTRVNAPFDCRVRNKQVDEGWFLTAGAPVAELYSLDFMEVRLPIAISDLPYLNLPMSAQGQEKPCRVTLKASLGKSVQEWEGVIVGTESEVDSKTRMLHAIARISNPFHTTETRQYPLTPGLFVDAEIEGREATGVIILPRGALWEGSRVLVVDENQTLHFREVDILRQTENRVVIKAGLADGEKVCLTRLEAVAQGMRVRVAEEDGERSRL